MGPLLVISQYLLISALNFAISLAYFDVTAISSIVTNDGVLSIRMSEKYRVVNCRALKPKILHKDPAHPLVLPLTCLLQSEIRWQTFPSSVMISTYAYHTWTHPSFSLRTLDVIMTSSLHHYDIIFTYDLILLHYDVITRTL